MIAAGFYFPDREQITYDAFTTVLECKFRLLTPLISCQKNQRMTLNITLIVNGQFSAQIPPGMAINR
jgi:hypothetical protein